MSDNEKLELATLDLSNINAFEQKTIWDTVIVTKVNDNYNNNIIADKWVSVEDFEKYYLYLDAKQLSPTANREECIEFNKKAKICSNYILENVGMYSGMVVYVEHDNKRIPIKYRPPIYNNVMMETGFVNSGEVSSAKNDIYMSKRNENPRGIARGFNKYRKMFIDKALNGVDVGMSLEDIKKDPEKLEKLIQIIEENEKNPTLKKVQAVRDHITHMRKLCKDGYDKVFGNGNIDEVKENTLEQDNSVSGIITENRKLHTGLEEI